MIHPLPNKTMWPHVNVDDILPLLVKKASGRPKLNRRRESDKVPAHRRRFILNCSVCDQFGYNRRACPVNPANANKMTSDIRYSFLYFYLLYTQTLYYEEFSFHCGINHGYWLVLMMHQHVQQNNVKAMHAQAERTTDGQSG